MREAEEVEALHQEVAAEVSVDAAEDAEAAEVSAVDTTKVPPRDSTLLPRFLTYARASSSEWSRVKLFHCSLV